MGLKDGRLKGWGIDGRLSNLLVLIVMLLLIRLLWYADWMHIIKSMNDSYYNRVKTIINCKPRQERKYPQKTFGWCGCGECTSPMVAVSFGSLALPDGYLKLASESFQLKNPQIVKAL